MLKGFFAFHLLLFSLLANATNYTSSNGHNVESVYAGYSDKIAFFEISGSAPNPNDCAGVPIRVDPEKSDVNQVLAILLYAHAAGKEVDLQIYTDGCIDSHRVLRRVKVVSS